MYELGIDVVQEKILLIGGRKVMLDVDLAALYGVPTKRLLEQVRRNASRFPDDFMFQLSEPEFKLLRSQIATLNILHRKYLPFCFTEQGVAMVVRTALPSPFSKGGGARCAPGDLSPHQPSLPNPSPRPSRGTPFSKGRRCMAQAPTA